MGIDGYYWHPEVRKSDCWKINAHWIFHGYWHPEVRIKLEKSN